jgi:hypothetical protein
VAACDSLRPAAIAKESLQPGIRMVLHIRNNQVQNANNHSVSDSNLRSRNARNRQAAAPLLVPCSNLPCRRQKGAQGEIAATAEHGAGASPRGGR